MPFDGKLPGVAREDVVTVLLAAADLIKDPGLWCRRVLYDSRGRHCAMGAVRAAAISLHGPCDYPVMRVMATRALAEALRARMSPSSLIEFNDDPHTTHADVLAVFREAAELAKREMQ